MSAPHQSSVSSPYFLDLLDVDFKAEILAASLAGQHVAPERIIINPTGLYSRAYSKDIEDVRDWLLEGSTFIYNRIDTPREGLFDMMPQYLFFKPIEPANPGNVDQLLDDIRRDRDEEQQARLFFLPFDAELNHLRTLSVHYDNSVNHLDHATAIIGQFAEHWPILNDMSRTQAGVFIQILPWLHVLRSNLPWFGRFLHLFFGVPVQVETGRRRPESTRADSALTLSDFRLGVDSVVSDHFSSDEQTIQINVGPVPDALVAHFLPHTQTIALLHKLVDYFLPVSSDISVSIITEPEVRQPDTTFLGYNSFL